MAGGEEAQETPVSRQSSTCTPAASTSSATSWTPSTDEVLTQGISTAFTAAVGMVVLALLTVTLVVLEPYGTSPGGGRPVRRR
ncbi:hypothetical protein [Streptomyces niveus]|uniref:hypothetical protein n=1 Tax=Streptomyces niveus TaxID=193462 RepID=UPI00343BEA5F